MNRYGFIPSIKDRRDLKFSATPAGLMDESLLPASMDLRMSLPPVMNQYSLGSCTAHGVTAALRFNMINSGQPDVPLSRLQMYYDSRALEGTIASDAGAQIRDVIKVAAKGVGREDLWPYDLTKWDQTPPADVDADAPHYQAFEYRSVDVSVRAIKTALYTERPVILGITVYDSFESDAVAQTGIVPMPAAGEAVISGHCMLAVGYGQKPGYFTVRNSWGPLWGDEGNCYLPESYLGSTEFASDLWVIFANTGAPP